MSKNMETNEQIARSANVSSASKVRVLSPFTLEVDQAGKFLNLNLTGVIELTLIKDPSGDFFAEGDSALRRGSLLNISDGGVLFESADLVPEGTVISLSFELDNGVVITDILAVINRIDSDEEGIVTGAAFVSRNDLADTLSGAELEMLHERFSGFEHRVSSTLNQYLA